MDNNNDKDKDDYNDNDNDDDNGNDIDNDNDNSNNNYDNNNLPLFYHHSDKTMGSGIRYWVYDYHGLSGISFVSTQTSVCTRIWF